MLCCRQWQFSVLCVSRSMGEGRLTSSRIVLTIDDYQILQTSAWAHFGVISEQAPVFCQIFFWPVMHIFSSPLFFHVLLEQYSPHLCVKQPIFSVILGKSCVFFQATLISQTPSFPLSILHCFLRMECSISLQYFQYLHVRTASCGVRSLTDSWVCYLHIRTTHKKYFRLYDPEPINIHQLK